MKKEIRIALLCILVAGVLVGVSSLIVKGVEISGYKKSDTPLPRGFTYTGHTGCNETVDNSIESMEVAVNHGADIIEFDVQYNGKEHILAHDEIVGGEVTLREAFLKLKELKNVKANVDIKTTEQVGKIQDLAEEIGVLDQIFLTGVKLEFVADVSENCPKIPYYLNMNIIHPEKDEHIENYLKNITSKVKQYGAIGLNINKNSAYGELVEACHKEGLLVSVWTVDKEWEIYKMMSYGVDNITTRRPDIVKKVLAERK